MKMLKIFFATMMTLTLAALIGCAETKTRQSSGEYVDDTAITTKVKTAIYDEPSLKSAEINVETFKGVVQLSGFVGGLTSLSKAGEDTRSVRGVKLVNNDLRVR